MAIGARTVIVPQEVPIAIEMMQAMMNSPGTANPGKKQPESFSVFQRRWIDHR
jgi:hypothetical protein